MTQDTPSEYVQHKLAQHMKNHKSNQTNKQKNWIDTKTKTAINCFLQLLLMIKIRSLF